MTIKESDLILVTSHKSLAKKWHLDSARKAPKEVLSSLAGFSKVYCTLILLFSFVYSSCSLLSHINCKSNR